MAKTIATSDVHKKIAEAKSIRDKAEIKASAIELAILKELKDERKSLLDRVNDIELEIKKLSGKPASAPGATGGKRKKTEPVILEILRETPNLSCAEIQKHPKMIALYAPDKVASQAIKLGKMVKEKKLVKAKRDKTTVYLLP